MVLTIICFRILDGVTKITECLEYFINPLISMGQVKGVKLELFGYLKKNTKQTIEKGNFIKIIFRLELKTTL